MDWIATAFGQLTLAVMGREGLKPRQPRGGRRVQQPRALPRHLQGRYGIRDARRAARQAAQATGGEGAAQKVPCMVKRH